MYTVLYLLLCYSLSTSKWIKKPQHIIFYQNTRYVSPSVCYEPSIETVDMDIYTSVFPTESSTYPSTTHSHSTSITATPSHTTGIFVSTTSTGTKASTTTATPTSTPRPLPFQDLLILYVTVPVLGLLVVVAVTIALVSDALESHCNMGWKYWYYYNNNNSCIFD